MTLTVEEGLGLAEADSFLSLEAADAYWSDRPHATLSGPWLAASETGREGALREASAHLGLAYGERFSGVPTRGRGQALCWPRLGAIDRSGTPLGSGSIPREVLAATCELAARALSAPLMADRDRAGRVSEEAVTLDAVSTRTVYDLSFPSGPALPVVEGLLSPLFKRGGSRLLRG
ncbi:DnaT-like ssDNA-binding protein [Rhodospirillum sp. A1_3_36]|uniref:DnaT-like ssDNA-binding protein n=1 Tax=Rhodospirillum sp. A1_3_36 TaxID=3391666 RepID=UPI0039A68AC7